MYLLGGNYVRGYLSGVVNVQGVFDVMVYVWGVFFGGVNSVGVSIALPPAYTPRHHTTFKASENEKVWNRLSQLQLMSEVLETQ